MDINPYQAPQEPYENLPQKNVAPIVILLAISSIGAVVAAVNLAAHTALSYPNTEFARQATDICEGTANLLRIKNICEISICAVMALTTPFVIIGYWKTRKKS